MLAVIFTIQPSAMSYFGFTLLFKLSPPLVLAALAQMLIILQGDIDLSNGAFVGLVTCISRRFSWPTRRYGGTGADGGHSGVMSPWAG